MPFLQGVAGIDDAVFLHLGDGIGQQLVGHFRIELLDHGIAGGVVAVEVVVPADDGGIDEALHQVRLLLDQVAAGLDQGRIGVEAVIGEQDDAGLEAGRLSRPRTAPR